MKASSKFQTPTDPGSSLATAPTSTASSLATASTTSAKAPKASVDIRPEMRDSLDNLSHRYIFRSLNKQILLYDTVALNKVYAVKVSLLKETSTLYRAANILYFQKNQA